MKIVLTFLLVVFTILNYAQEKNDGLLLGADLLLSEYSHLIEGKGLGIVTNHTATLSSGKHLVDTLFEDGGFDLKALFAPEHGIRGAAPAGDQINNHIDEKTSLPVFSLYGQINKPTKEMLKDIDVLIYDIQDVGARFYTYISTLYYVIEAAAESDKEVIVLDRPNPINGVSVEGPIRKEHLTSFVGIAPIPIRHGLTVGELANLFVSEYFDKSLKPKLTVIKMLNWDRQKYFANYSNEWNPPSPNIPDFETTIVYPGTCLIEGINVSEGRGTYHPFLTIGAPYINSEEWIDEMTKVGIEGVSLTAVSFTPETIPHMATRPKYLNEKCFGIEIKVTDRGKFNAVEFGIKLICSLRKLYPDKLEFRQGAFDRLAGDDAIRKMILDDVSAEDIVASWQSELNLFKELRKNYLLY
jgi:uncharacterized protein YbbC (DUF1343 family)